MTLSGMANERMSRNGVLIDRLHRAVRETLFRTGADVACATAASTRTDDGKNDGHDCEEGDEAGVFKYKATLSRSLPPLNLWKTAAVVVRGVNGGSHDGVDDDDDRGNVIDVDVLAFGGQGIGPSESASAPAAEDEGAPSTGTSSRCRRHDDVFRLKRRGGAWSDRWEIMSRTAATGRTTATDAPPEADADSSADADPVVVTTSAGKFRIHVANEGMGRREGHAAVVVPPMLRRRPVEMERSADAVIVFGGRTTTRTTTTGEGGAQRSLSPSNDLFLFMMLPSSSPVLSKARILPSNCYAEEVASDRQQPERGDAVGLFGRPLDVRGTPPEPMYGFTMTALSNNKRRNGHPFAVLAGGTGFDRRCTPRDGTDDSTVCLASMYTLSCIAPDGCDGDDEEMEAFECSHFVWDRVADMPSPRSYHTSFVLEECNGNRNLIVFGGYEDSNDPFTSSASLSTSWFKAPLFFGGEDSINVVDVPRSDDTDAMLNIVVDNELLLPSRIGSSAVALCLESKIPVVLLVGGVKSTTSEPAPYSDSDHKHNGGFDGSDDGMAPPIILLAPQQKRHLPHDPIRMQSLFSSMSSSELEIVNSCDSSSSGSYDIDLGACVHHCLVALPRRQCDDDDDVAATSLMPDEDDPVSAIIVGGGVPSLSFGQSYARSYIVDVTRINVSSDAFQSNPAMHHKIIGFGAPNNTVASSSQCRSSVDKKINGRQPSATMTSHANVIYVNAHNAKDTKTVLESLGFLDKRYKMVKIKLDDQDDQLIAIPVTESFIDQSFADNEGGINSNDCTSRLKQWIVRRGTETVPFSSSLTGKMKQK
ncbi:hypothetical protein ACHAW5_009254 [Stephanodiscus triporus]|uniref:Uncharacterized protein n=1 Tax=Stephanodiscus triporus TaxID=2934178 RepID=A0ABD3NM49_9STRA